MARMSVSEALTLAQSHVSAGRPADAESICQAVVQALPDEVDAWLLYGQIALDRGDLAEAEDRFRRAIVQAPDAAAVHERLSATLARQGRHADAESAARRALHLSPYDAAAHRALAAAIAAQGRNIEAESAWRNAVSADPKSADACTGLAQAFFRLRRYPEAESQARRALAIDPQPASAWHALAEVLQAVGRDDEALAALQRVRAIAPHNAACERALGDLLFRLGRWTKANQAYRKALSLDPGDAPCWTSLARLLLAQGRMDDCREACRKALEIDPGQSATHSTALACEHVRYDATLPQLAELHAAWDQQHAAPLKALWQPHANNRDPQRALRLGFVSNAFCEGPLARLWIRVFEALRGQPCAVVCYADQTSADAMTARFRAVAATWREVPRMSDEQLAEQIRGDRIDVLFDLSGHGPGNRLSCFARKPAPIQVTWLGYEGTTGLEAMDYILADRHVIHASEDRHYREKVLRMPETLACYDPPAAAPDVGPLPAERQAYITFGSLTNPLKFTRPLFQAWAEILRRVPKSRLLLQYRGLGESGAQHRFQEWFSDLGGDSKRVLFADWAPHEQALAAYARIDVALDTFPVGSSATACDALWMGVPVITCNGRTFAGRRVASHLHNLGLAELIARDATQYVDLAVRLADDRARLAELRRGLRQRMADSPLCDGRRLAGHLMAAVRDAWSRYATGTPAVEQPAVNPVLAAALKTIVEERGGPFQRSFACAKQVLEEYGEADLTRRLMEEIPAACPWEVVADLLAMLSWSTQDQGAAISHATENWLRAGDDLRRVRIALHLDTFPFLERAEMEDVFARLSARWPDVAPRCEDLVRLRRAERE